MPRSGRDNRPGLTLLLALLLCGALTAVHRQSQRLGRVDPLAGGVIRDAALVPALTGWTRLGRWWQTNVMSGFAAPGLARRNAVLEAQVQTLTAQNRQLLAAQVENDRLRRLLHFQRRSPRPLLAAEVIALKPAGQVDTLTLDRGLSQQVHLQSVVLAPNGALVGQVLDVSYHSATVLLLTDSNSSVGAQVISRHKTASPASLPLGICQGDRAGHLLLAFPRIDAAVAPGDAVMTSGLGGVFPKKILIGTVASVSIDRTRSLKTALVRPGADFDHLEEAFVLVRPEPAPDAPAEGP